MCQANPALVKRGGQKQNRVCHVIRALAKRETAGAQKLNTSPEF